VITANADVGEAESVAGDVAAKGRQSSEASRGFDGCNENHQGGQLQNLPGGKRASTVGEPKSAAPEF
jgi:hypothetical protein